jgi:hypothetical protein
MVGGVVPSNKHAHTEAIKWKRMPAKRIAVHPEFFMAPGDQACRCFRAWHTFRARAQIAIVSFHDDRGQKRAIARKRSLPVI